MIRVGIVGLCLALAGCNTTGLEKIDAGVHKYAPIFGKNLLLVADILVTAECSPALATGSQTVVNILKIVAPDSKRAATVANVLNTNVQVAGQLCPLVQAVQTEIGKVPAGLPAQVIPATGV